MKTLHGGREERTFDITTHLLREENEGENGISHHINLSSFSSVVSYDNWRKKRDTPLEKHLTSPSSDR